MKILAINPSPKFNKRIQPNNYFNINYPQSGLKKDTVSFKSLGNIYGHEVEYTDDYTVINDDYDTEGNIGNNVTIRGHLNLRGDRYIGNDFRAKSVYSSSSIELGDYATIEEDIKSSCSYISAGKYFAADTIFANEDVKLGDYIKVNMIDTMGNVTLGKINEIHMINLHMGAQDYDDGVRVMTLTSEDIDQEKITVNLGKINSLTIKTPSGSEEILKKFEFKDSESNEIIDPESSAIKITVEKNQD